MEFVANSKMWVFYQPVGYFVRVLRVIRFNAFNVNIAHANNAVCPFQQLESQTLGTMIATVVPEFPQSEQHLVWDLV
jgi:hypothetical protein